MSCGALRRGVITQTAPLAVCGSQIELAGLGTCMQGIIMSSNRLFCWLWSCLLLLPFAGCAAQPSADRPARQEASDATKDGVDAAVTSQIQQTINGIGMPPEQQHGGFN